MSRKRLTEAASRGMLAGSALIAHGRGEAFDYLLGERTSAPGRAAIRETAARLRAASRPVLSLNGNAVALAGADLLACAAALNCPVEINIYYRTPERMDALLAALEEMRAEAMAAHPDLPIAAVEILGAAPDARIPGLDGPRANCHAEGILSADALLVPLEDGDRCEALVGLGKTVCVIDLNPMSRTAKTACVTIVDELTRCVRLLLEDLLSPDLVASENWRNEKNLEDSLQVMLRNLGSGSQD